MGIFNLGGGGGEGGPVLAADVTFDNDASGLTATDVQAAIDEVVSEKLDVPGFVIWENVDWETLISGTGAPTSSTGAPDWFYLDTTTGDEALYGPATFDPGIPGMDWGSPLANFIFSATGPSDEAGDWYVWDENGDGSVYTLFQKKTAINYGDMLFWNGSDWEARTGKLFGQDVYVNLTGIESSFGVKNAQTELFNLESYSTRTYGGYWSDQIVETVQGTYELPVGFANNFLITLDGNTTLDLPTDMNAAIGFADSLANKSSEVSLIIKQGSAGPYNLTWGTMISQPNGGITLTNHADEADWFKLITFDNGTTWFLSRVGHRYDV
jgi:hypothetical protein